MNRMRKILVATLLVGGAATAIGAGTFASFSASTSNSGTFATGTLVLSNLKNAATICYSDTAGITDTNAKACDAAFAATNEKPGGGTYETHLTITNEGTLDATALKLFSTSACAPGI